MGSMSGHCSSVRAIFNNRGTGGNDTGDEDSALQVTRGLRELIRFGGLSLLGKNI